MERKLRFARQSNVVFAIITILALAVSLTSLLILARTLTQSSATIESDLHEIIAAEKLRSNIEQKTASARGFFLTGEDRFLSSSKFADRKTSESFGNLLNLANTPQEKATLAELRVLKDAYDKTVAEGIALKQKGIDQQRMVKYFDLEITPARTKISEFMDNFQTLKEREFVEARSSTRVATARSLTIIISITALTLLLVLSVAFMLNKTLKLQAQRLAKANSDLEEYGSIISHDLKTPLMTISGYLEILRDECGRKLSPEACDMMDHTIAGAARMTSLIDELLVYARAEKTKLEKERLDLNLVLQEALADLKAAIKQKNASIESSKLPTIDADKSQMLQLFRNLICNAIKFQKENNKPHVQINAELNGGFWQFAVRDNGIGFDPTCAEKIFQPFERRHRQSDIPGTGLGLAICKKVVERHGGTIWAEAKPGQGATFYFRLATT